MFYEDDEPVGHVQEAFEMGDKNVATPYVPGGGVIVTASVTVGLTRPESVLAPLVRSSQKWQ